jgi:hypothetical protein
MQPAKIGSNQNLKTIPKTKIHTVLEEGEFGAMLDLKVWNPKTGDISFDKSMKSESYVQQFMQLLYAQFVLASAVDDPVSIRDTGNTLRNVGPVVYGLANAGFIFDVLAGAGVATYGIAVGTGNTAPVITNYVLETPIAHGVGAGQLQYSAVTFGAPSADATTSQLTITRNFANGSGGAITVNEVVLYCRAVDDVPAARYFMLIRDVIAGGVAVPNGQTLTVNYRPQAVI